MHESSINESPADVAHDDRVSGAAQAVYGDTSAGQTPTVESSASAGTGTNRTVFWLIGGLFVVLLFGCMMTSIAALLVSGDFVGRSTVRRTTLVSEAAPEVIRAALPTPRPMVVVAPEDGVDYENAVFANLYEQVNPSVVNVTTLISLESLQDSAPHSFTPRGVDPDDLIESGSGSGFIWDAVGHIVTNNHVVDSADELHITFSDGRVSVAELVGTDLDSDLAVLRIDPEGYDLVPIQRGSLDDIFVGMRVAAIGNPFGLEGTLTGGIISAMGRSIPARGNYSIPDSIQTDAAINPGNSGGPLLNERGELIGVNAQIRSSEGVNSGVGFAIPISIVDRVVPELIADGKYEHSYMGVAGQTYNPICADLLGLPKSARGSLVVDVLRGTPAAKAGLRAGDSRVDSPYPSICPTAAGGDLIVAVNGQPVTTFDDILIYLARYGEPGGELPLTVLRGGEEITVTLTLVERP